MKTWLSQIHLENLLLRPIVGNSSKAHLIMSMPLINHIVSLKSTLLYCLMLLQLGCYKIHFPLLASFVRFCQQGQHARWRLEVRRKAEKTTCVFDYILFPSTSVQQRSFVLAGAISSSLQPLLRLPETASPSHLRYISINCARSIYQICQVDSTTFPFKLLRYQYQLYWV